MTELQQIRIRRQVIRAIDKAIKEQTERAERTTQAISADGVRIDERERMDRHAAEMDSLQRARAALAAECAQMTQRACGALEEARISRRKREFLWRYFAKAEGKTRLMQEMGIKDRTARKWIADGKKGE